MTGNMVRDFTKGPLLKQLLFFSLPLMGANLLQMCYNMIDMVVIGQFVGKAGLSAVSIGGDIMHLITFVGLGFATATQVILSQFIGAGRKDQLIPTIGTAFVALGVIAVVVSATGFVCVDKILTLMNTPIEAMNAAQSYAKICLMGLLFIYGYNLVSAILRGLGNSKYPFLFICIATVVNLVLDLLFVAGFEMGPAGAALATVIGQAVSFICSLIFLYGRRASFGFDFNSGSFSVDRDILKRLIKLGLPMSLQSMAISISGMFVNSFINAYGVVTSAASGVGHKLCTCVSVVTQGLSAAGSSMVGQNLGANNYNRVSRLFNLALAINLSFAALFSAVTVLFPKAVFGIFTQEADVLDMTMRFLPCAVIDVFGFASRSPVNALINGSGRAKLNLFMGIMDGIVSRIGLAMLLGVVLDLGIMGLWYGSTCSGLVPFIIGFIFFKSGKWRNSPQYV